MKTKISKTKVMLKANGNYKPNGSHGKKYARSQAQKDREKKLTKEYIENRKKKQAKFDAKHKDVTITSWCPRTLQNHYKKSNDRDFNTVYLKVNLVELHKNEVKERKAQSKKDKLAFKNSIIEFKSNYKPTGNKEDNPAFNGYMPIGGRQFKKLNNMHDKKMRRICKHANKKNTQFMNSISKSAA